MSGGFNPISMVSQVALGAMTGGTSLIAQMAMQIAMQVAKEVIQQVGQQLGLPQPMIDAAQGAFDMASGNAAGAAQEFQQAAGGAAGMVSQLGQQSGASPTEIGQQQQSIDEAKNQQILDMVKQGQSFDEDGNSKSSGSIAAKGGWLMAIAKSLANQLTAQGNELEKKMQSTDWKDAGATAEFQAQSQQFNLVMSTATNVIKTLGEALSNMARKN